MQFIGTNFFGFISVPFYFHKSNLKTINEGIRQLTDLYLICIRNHVG